MRRRPPLKDKGTAPRKRCTTTENGSRQRPHDLLHQVTAGRKPREASAALLLAHSCWRRPGAPAPPPVPAAAMPLASPQGTRRPPWLSTPGTPANPAPDKPGPSRLQVQPPERSSQGFPRRQQTRVCTRMHMGHTHTRVYSSTCGFPVPPDGRFPAPWAGQGPAGRVSPEWLRLGAACGDGAQKCFHTELNSTKPIVSAPNDGSLQ